MVAWPLTRRAATRFISSSSGNFFLLMTVVARLERDEFGSPRQVGMEFGKESIRRSKAKVVVIDKLAQQIHAQNLVPNFFNFFFHQAAMVLARKA
jgi:hypothetical protein